MLILDDLLALPVKGFFELFKKIQEMVGDELYDPERIKDALAQLNEAYEIGEIEKEKFQKYEKKLLERLEIGMERSAKS